MYTEHNENKQQTIMRRKMRQSSIKKKNFAVAHNLLK